MWAFVLAMLARGPALTQDFEPKSASDGVVLSGEYPRSDFELAGEVVVEKPGTVLDTIGLNSAPTGSWTLEVRDDFRFVLRIWDGSSWRLLATQRQAGRGVATSFRFVRVGAAIQSWVAGAKDAAGQCATPLSQARAYMGDFKGDEGYGAQFRIHQGMVGRIRIQTFSAPGQAGAQPAGEPDAAAEPAKPLPATTLQDNGMELVVPASVNLGGARLKVEPCDLPAPAPKGAEVLATFNFTLGDLHEFDDPLEIPVSDEGIKDPGMVRAALWDEAAKTWVLLPTKHDKARGLIVARTVHLSPISWWTVTQWFHDVVETEHFKITYRSAAIRSDPERSDEAWGRAMASHPDKIGLPIPKAKDGVPLFVQDLAQTLEYAYASYRTAGFSVPTWTSTDVVIGSGGVLEEPFRDKLTGLIFLPAVLGKAYARPGSALPRRDVIRTAVAHELFHTVQGQTFSMNGLNLRKWFIECSAEFAARRIAFGAAYDLEPLTATQLENPMVSSDDEQNYQTAHFFDFLQRRGFVRFAEVYKAVAGRGSALGDNLIAPLTLASEDARLKAQNSLTTLPIERLAAAKGAALGDWYSAYMAAALFEQGSPLKPGPDAKAAGDKVIQACGLTVHRITPDKQALELPLTIRAGYCGKVVPLASTLPQPVELEVSMNPAPPGLAIDLYVVGGDKRTATSPKPIARLGSSGSGSAKFKLSPGDVAYAAALNRGTTSASTVLKVGQSGAKSAKTFDFVGLADDGGNLPARVRVDHKLVENGKVELKYFTPPLKGAGGQQIYAGYTRFYKNNWTPLSPTLAPGQTVEVAFTCEIEGDNQQELVVYSPTVVVETVSGGQTVTQPPAKKVSEESGPNKIKSVWSFPVPPLAGSLRITILMGGISVTYTYKGA